MEIKSKVIQHTFRNKYLKYGGTTSNYSLSNSTSSSSNSISKWFYEDEDGNLHSKLSFIGDGEISAYGAGDSGTGGDVTIIDNLTSTAIDCALSANMGRHLKSLIDGKTSISSWNDITDKPSTFTPSAHSHSIAEVTNLQTALDGKAASSHTHNYASTIKVGTTAYNVASNAINLPAYPTTLPASDVYGWAKSSIKPSYSWSEITSKPTSLSGYGVTDGYKILSISSDSISSGSDIMQAGYYAGIGSYASFVQYGWGGQLEFSLGLRYRFLNNGSAYSWQSLLTSNNYNSFCPALNGLGAYGVWGITSKYLDGIDERNTTIYPNTYDKSVRFIFRSNGIDSLSDGGLYHGVLHYRSYGGGSDLSGGAVHQLAFTDNGNMWNRCSLNTSSWGSWNKILNSSNYNQYSPTLTGGGASGNWNININGASTKVGDISLPTYIDSGSNIFQNNGIVYQSGIQGVNPGTIQLLARWANVINSSGYQTAYAIGSSRGGSGFGNMTFWVGNNDALTSGNYMTLGTNDLMYWSGHITSAKYITSGAGYRFAGENREITVYNGRVGYTTEEQSEAIGVNVGSLLVSSAWADYTKVPTNGIYSKGNILSAGEVTAYSDARLKSDIKPLENRGYITPVTYAKDGKQSIGFIAQDVQKLYPELIAEGTDEKQYLSMNYAQYVAVLQAQIIELNRRLTQLETKQT